VRAGLVTQLAEQHRTAAREDRKEILLLAWGRRGRSTRKGLNEIKKNTPRSGYSTGPERLQFNDKSHPAQRPQTNRISRLNVASTAVNIVAVDPTAAVFPITTNSHKKTPGITRSFFIIASS